MEIEIDFTDEKTITDYLGPKGYYVFGDNNGWEINGYGMDLYIAKNSTAALQ